MSVEPSYNGSFRSYSYNRQETEAAIRILCKRYPKCFFEDPHLRRPLENNIISDLEKDGAPLEYDLLVRAVEFYQTHFGYRYNIQAGARKINLDGKEVSIVTESEFLNTQKKIREDKAKRRESHYDGPGIVSVWPNSRRSVEEDRCATHDEGAGEGNAQGDRGRSASSAQA